MENERVDFSWINDNFEVVVFDMAPLIGYLRGKGKRGKDDCPKFINFLKEVSNRNSNWFFPLKVLDEALYLDSESVKKNIKAKRCLEKLSRRCNNMVNLNKQELNFVEYYKDFMPVFAKKYNLTPADFWVLMHGKIFTYTRGSAALISNDITGIATAWRYFINNNDPVFRLETFGFFPRRGLNQFERLQ